MKINDYKILLVDDEPDILEILEYNLSKEGFCVYKAGNGRDAIALAMETEPHMIILDLMMPEMDGFAVLDALKANPDTAHIPVIVSTAKELTVEERGRLQGQIQTLLQKGDFMSDEFIEEVKALIR